MLKTALGRFRMIALYEGLSYLVLLIIAMPMKYLMDIPQPVTIVGALHGLLFVLYMLALAQVAWQKKNGKWTQSPLQLSPLLFRSLPFIWKHDSKSRSLSPLFKIV